MESIVNQIAVSPGIAASIALPKYLQLLRNETATGDENRDALALTAHVLGRTAEQVAADVIVIRRLKQLEELTQHLPAIKQTAQQAATDLETFDAESSRLQTERVQRRMVIAGNAVVARDRQTEAANADLEIQQLVNSNPDLLGK